MLKYRTTITENPKVNPEVCGGESEGQYEPSRYWQENSGYYVINPWLAAVFHDDCYTYELYQVCKK